MSDRKAVQQAGEAAARARECARNGQRQRQLLLALALATVSEAAAMLMMAGARPAGAA